MIASHYAEPLERQLAAPATLRAAPEDDGEPIVELAAGDRFAMLDSRGGWAWGYGGADRRVGYLPLAALARG